MITTETYLKTQQVADALGVSVSSIKRWVDSGALEATRTMGRHRLVALSAALAFARREGLPLNGLMSLSVPTESVALDDHLGERLLDALKAGDDRESTMLIASAHRSAGGIVAVADDLIRPTLERVGTAWFLGKWDVYEEHQATALVMLALAGINYGLIRDQAAGRPLALVATPEGDPFTVPSLLAEIVVREAGWDVRNLGGGLPLRSLAAATRQHRPRMIALSISRVADRSRFINDYAYFYEAASQVGAAVILGGRGLDPDLRSRLIYASFGDRMAHLAEFARRMLPPTAPSTSRDHG